MKSSRQEQILDIISKKDVLTQNQLMDELMARGVKTTQATLSRDIRDLHLVKELSPNGVYKYAAVHKKADSDRESRLRKIFKEGVISYDIAQNLIVLKTLPGLASAACSALDGMGISAMVGTIAGDDTAFLAMRDNKSAEEFCAEIENLL